LFVEIGRFPLTGSIQLALGDTQTSTDWTIESMNRNTFLFIASGEPPTSIAFDATQVWWRLRPVGGAVVYETSADGEAWTIQYSSTSAAPATVAATIEDIVDAPTPDAAIVDGIDICP
jgi:hypothetical protein